MPSRCEAMRVALMLALLAAASCGDDEAPTTRISEPEAADSIAVLIAVRGDVRWSRAGSRTWESASTGQPLSAADAVQTMESGRATVRFARTGALAELSPGTVLRVPHQAAAVTRLTHLSGVMRARFEPSAAGERMEVQLPPGTLVMERPEGSGSAAEFEAHVQIDGDQTEVSMTQGNGVVEPTRGAPVAVGPNEFVRLRANGDVVDQGRSGPPIVLVSPGDAEVVETRAPVRFSWEPIAQADVYRFRAEGADGAMIERETPDGELTIDFGASGGWRWQVRGARGEHAMAASPWRTLEVLVDVTAPELRLTSPTSGSRVTGSTVRVVGRTEPLARLQINGRESSVRRDGSFSVDIPARRGVMNLVLRATDRVGNTRVVTSVVLVR